MTIKGSRQNRFSSLCHQPPRSLFPCFSLDTNGSTELKLACRTFQPNPPNFTVMPIKIKTNSFYIASSSQFIVTAISSIFILLADMKEPLHKDKSFFIDFKRFNVICSSDFSNLIHWVWIFQVRFSKEHTRLFRFLAGIQQRGIHSDLSPNSFHEHFNESYLGVGWCKYDK